MVHGIRFVIFMQGCTLRCKYCHNRDTWDLCGGTDFSLEEVLNRIRKYKNYFIPSGGGVTISGGEPLLLLKFLLELLPILKSEGIHVAIDTSGSFEITDDIKKVINLADLFLLDIKCINDEICKDLTGVSNKKELAFARYLSDIKKPMWIRQVLVPGITDKEEDLLDLKAFISSLQTVQKVEILPYHDMGSFKWKSLGVNYPLEEIPVATIEDVNRAKIILEI
jgi:pyruvate formate lyase activating enzyme